MFQDLGGRAELSRLAERQHQLVHHSLKRLLRGNRSNFQRKAPGQNSRAVGETAGRVEFQKPSSHIETSCGDQLAVVEQRQIGGAAADVKVQNAAVVLLAVLIRPGAAGGQNALQIRAGSA